MSNVRYLAENIIVSNDTRVTGLNNNDMIIGSSGAGKTGGYVIPNIINITGSMIVSDTKGQLFKMCRETLENKGYKVYSVDFCNPEKSCGYNPLKFIRTNKSGGICEKDVLTLAKAVMPCLDKQEPFWEKAASGYIAFLIGFCMEAINDDEHNMSSVCKLHRAFIRPGGDLPFVCWIKENPNSFSARKYDRIKATLNADKMWSSIYEFANRALDLFEFEEVRNIFENNDSIDIESIGKEKAVVFLNTSDTDRTFDYLSDVFFTQALQTLCSLADSNEGGRLKVPVRIVMDDFASGARIPDFDKVISVIRSREISVSLILQSLSQLESMYGKANAKTIINNCDHLIYLGSQDMETAEYIGCRVLKTPEYVLCLPKEKAVLLTSGEKARIVNKIKPYSMKS